VKILCSKTELFEITGAGTSAGSFSRRLHCRQEEPNKNTDNCNHDEQFNKRECS
jgi:hypothetical protein